MMPIDKTKMSGKANGRYQISDSRKGLSADISCQMSGKTKTAGSLQRAVCSKRLKTRAKD